MTWSTRELADLAGTTVNTVRHYHAVGLLEEPDRGGNGYKHYEVEHLVRLLRILRLRDLGVPLDRIDEMAADDAAPDALRSVDADLAASIERLQRARAEIAAIMRGGTTTDVPAGFESIASRLSRADRSLILIYSRIYDDAAMADLRTLLDRYPDPASVEFEALPEHADEATKDRVTAMLAPVIADALVQHPWLLDPGAHAQKDDRTTRGTFLAAIHALYNRAQLEVLARASTMAVASLGQGPGGADRSGRSTRPA